MQASSFITANRPVGESTSAHSGCIVSVDDRINSRETGLLMNSGKFPLTIIRLAFSRSKSGETVKNPKGLIWFLSANWQADSNSTDTVPELSTKSISITGLVSFSPRMLVVREKAASRVSPSIRILSASELMEEAYSNNREFIIMTDRWFT